MLDPKAIKDSLDEIQAVIDARAQNLADWEAAAQRNPQLAAEAFGPEIRTQDAILVDAIPELMEYARAYLASITAQKGGA